MVGTFSPCQAGFLGPNVGVTGTPAIDTSALPHPILYVVAAVYTTATYTVDYDLFAIDAYDGNILSSVVINGTVSGMNPGPTEKCHTTYPTSGELSFDSNHVQRSALLLQGNYAGSFGSVYVAFAPSGSEWENGWIFAYSYNTANGFSQGPYFATTPHGTGGGIWESGAGPAFDGASIFAVTGNGTFQTAAPTDDYGDSLLRLTASNLTVADYYAPPDSDNYSGTLGSGRCINDIDFGSGGVMVFPDAFTYNGLSPLVNADKESRLYVTNRNNLGGFNQSGGNNIETILTPPLTHSGQGYWASPAYWQVDNSGTSQYYLYYAVTMDLDNTAVPYQMYQYSLQTSGSSGPITTSNSSATLTSFCPLSPTPSVSSNPGTHGQFGATGSGILWAIEDANSANSGSQQACNGTKLSAVLHAHDAAGMNELYNSSSLQTTIGDAVAFSTPTVFQGRVYIGTSTNYVQGEVDVFGLCSSLPTKTCLP